MEILVVYGILLLFFTFFNFFYGFKVNLTNLFYLLFFAFYGPEFIIYNWSPLISNNQVILGILMCITITCFFIANWLTKFYFNGSFNDKYHYAQWIKLPFVTLGDRLNETGILIGTSFVVLITGLGLFVYGGISTLKEAFSLSSLVPEYFDYLRSESGAKGWVAPIYNYTTSSLGRFIVFLGLAVGFYRKKNWFLILSGMGVLLIMLSQLSNLMKSSTLFFILQLFVLYKALSAKAFKFRTLAIQIFLFLGLLTGFYLTLTNADSLSMSIELIKHRIFEIPNEVLQMYIDTWPDQKPHTYGMNIRLVHLLFGKGEFESSDAYLCGFPGCTFNAIFIGDAWVDFSYFGVIWESLFLGFYLALLDFFVFRKRNEISIALFPSLIIGILLSSSVAMLATMITFGLLSVPVLALFFYNQGWFNNNRTGSN